MNIHELINATLDITQEQLSIAERPCIAFSGGKDSTVMAHLINLLNPNVPAIYFDGFPHPTKHAFTEQFLANRGIEMIRPVPMGRDVIRATDGRVEIVEVFRIDERATMYFPIEAEVGYEPDENALCGRAKIVDGLIVEKPLGFDAVFIGHRADDVDPTHGAVPIEHHVIEYDDFRYIYPLKDWAEADIWEASALLSIEQNAARYVEGDMDYNPDYWPLCTKCLCGSTPVICPKTEQLIDPLHSESELDARREGWRQTFVNLPVCH